MSINPNIYPTVGNPITIFASKCTIQYGVLVLWINHLQSRQMMSNHHNMTSRALFDTFPDKINTGLMHPIEFLYL